MLHFLLRLAVSATAQPLVNLGFVEQDAFTPLVKWDFLRTCPTVNSLFSRMVRQILYQSSHIHPLRFFAFACGHQLVHFVAQFIKFVLHDSHHLWHVIE